MALVYDTELTPALIGEIELLIDSCDVESLLQVSRQVESLIRGFQIKPANVKIIRQRLKNALNKSGEMDLPIKEFIAGNSLNRLFVCVLSAEALKQCLNELLTVLGVEPMLVGLLFDSREEVRQLGRDCLKHPPRLDKNVPEARRELSNKLEEFTNIFLFVSDKSITTPPALPGTNADQDANSDSASKQEIERLKKLLEEYKCNHKEVKVLSKKLAAVTQKYQQQEDEYDKLKNNYKNIRRDYNSLQEDLTNRQHQLEQLRQHQDSLVKDGVTKELETLSYSWLKHPIAVEKYRDAASSRNGEDIFSRIDTVLEQQVRQDRHYGNIRELNERLSRLQGSKQRLEQAANNSIKPLPELKSLCRQVDNEIAELRQILGQQSSDNQFSNVCLTQINRADSPEEIIAVEDMLQLFSKLKLISAAELNHLYRSYNEKLGLLLEKYPPETVSTANDAWWFYSLLRRHDQLNLLLDGHNILHLLSSIFAPYYENDIPGAAAREELIQRLIKLLESYPTCRINLFFDGPTPSESSPAANLKVIYSGGGQREHRADEVIMKYLNYIRINNEAAAVISDDRDIQNYAREAGAKVIPPTQIAALLEQ